jgi:hypothetical protein
MYFMRGVIRADEIGALLRCMSPVLPARLAYVAIGGRPDNILFVLSFSGFGPSWASA